LVGYPGWQWKNDEQPKSVKEQSNYGQRINHQKEIQIEKYENTKTIKSEENLTLNINRLPDKPNEKIDFENRAL